VEGKYITCPCIRKFVCPEGVPYECRSLPPGPARPYHVYEVIKPVRVKAGKIAPCFNQQGGGVQYQFNKTIAKLLKSKIIREVFDK